MEHVCVLKNTPPRRHCTLFEISEHHPYTKHYIRSVSRLNEERQNNHCYRSIVHPLSMFRLHWELLFFGVLYISVVLEMFSVYTATETGPLTIACFVFDCFCILDLSMNFGVGVFDAEASVFVMEPGEIRRMYVRSWQFYVDIITSLPTNLLLLIIGPAYEGGWRLLYLSVQSYSFVKIIRLVKCFKYFDNSIEFYIKSTFAALILKSKWLFYALGHCITCLYLYMITFPFLEDDKQLYHYSAEPDLTQFNNIDRYYRSAYIIISYMLSINSVSSLRPNSRYISDTPFIFAVNVILSIIGMVVLDLILLFAALQMVVRLTGSDIRFFAIMSQVQQYIKNKKLPMHMHKRILTYYEYRFQRKYFNEELILNMLSDTLRKEIYLQSCRSLIDSVSILKDLPQDIISELVANLKYEVFLHGDTIVKAGTVGDSMYFIASGTVAVLTPSGREICHLQDGAYFGEIALLSNDQKRVANVVAIEVCEVYRMDRRNFKLCFPLHSFYHRKLEQIAKERMEKTLLLEDLHKRYMKDKLMTSVNYINKP